MSVLAYSWSREIGGVPNELSASLWFMVQLQFGTLLGTKAHGEDAAAAAAANVPREYEYNISPLSGSFKYRSGHGIKESVGVEMIILILCGQFLVDFSAQFQRLPGTASSICWVVEGYRNVLGRAGVAE